MWWFKDFRYTDRPASVVSGSLSWAVISKTCDITASHTTRNRCELGVDLICIFFGRQLHFFYLLASTTTSVEPHRCKLMEEFRPFRSLKVHISWTWILCSGIQWQDKLISCPVPQAVSNILDAANSILSTLARSAVILLNSKAWWWFWAWSLPVNM